MEVKIINVEPTMVAALEHRGDPALVNETVQHFIEWRKTTGLSPIGTSETYGIAYSTPDVIPTADFRFDVCGSVQETVPSNLHGVITKVIPGGRCAVVCHAGSRDRLGESVRYLFRQWLPKSGEEVRDFPVYFRYLTLGFDRPESEHLTNIYLPLKA